MITKKSTRYTPISLLLMVMLWTKVLVAQFTVNVPISGNGNYGYSELSQISMANLSGNTLNNCYAVIRAEESNGTVAYLLKTPVFNLNAGINLLSYQDVINAEVLQSSASYSKMQQTGNLPSGTYTTCVDVYVLGNSNGLAKQCATVKTKDDDQVVLLSPNDGQVINTFFPTFFWNFGTPQPDYTVTYSIKIAELKDGQSYYDAMYFNAPIVFEQNYMSTTYNYSSSSFPLNEDKQYVWQVEANVRGKGKYLSPIWMFRFKKDKRNPVKKTPVKEYVQYAYLTKQASATSYSFTDKINLRYNNEAGDSVLNYVVYKQGETRAVTISDQPAQLHEGINYFSFNVPDNMKPKKEKEANLYTLQVRNARNEVWSMKFIINSNNKKKK